jgi:hypothetical protein
MIFVVEYQQGQNQNQQGNQKKPVRLASITLSPCFQDNQPPRTRGFAAPKVAPAARRFDRQCPWRIGQS